MLAGVPIDPSLRHAPLADVFAAIEKQRGALAEVAPERVSFIAEVERRVVETCGQADAAYVSGHLKWIAKAKRTVEDANADYPLGAYRYSGTDDVYLYFKDRYDPRALREKGAHPNVLADSRFSVFASPDAFQWLKDVFSQGRVRYVQADISDPAAYAAIGAWARELGCKVSGLSTSNIWDYGSKNARRVTSEVAWTIETAIAAMPTDESFSVYRTRDTKPPHGYERYDVRGLDDVRPALDRAGLDVSDLERRSNLELILHQMASAEPRLEEASRSHVRLYLGPDLHVFWWGAYFKSYAKTLREFLEFEPPSFSLPVPGTKNDDRLRLPVSADRERVVHRLLEELVKVRRAHAGVDEFLTDLGVPPNTTVQDVAQVLAQADQLQGRRFR
jgi:hypothetical protein